MQFELLSGHLDVEMLPCVGQDASLYCYACISSDRRAYALIDPFNVQEADMLADLYDLDVRQLVWDEAPESNANAPYLVSFEKNDLFDSLLLAQTAFRPAGIWDRQSPFVIVSDESPEHVAKALQDWLRPALEASDTTPYLRFWQGGTAVALMLSGDMVQANFPGDLVLGIGPPKQRRRLKLSLGTSSDVAPVHQLKISKTGQSAISTAHRATHHLTLAVDLHDVSDPFDKLHLLIRNSFILGDHGGLQGNKFEPLLSNLSYDYGWGFMYDLQYPALARLLEQVGRLTPVHVRALLTQWDDFMTSHIGAASAQRENTRLLACRALSKRERSTAKVTMQDLATIDPEKKKLHSESMWNRILYQWEQYFAPIESDDFDCRTLCLLAYCTGQFMMQDPLRRARIESVFKRPLPVIAVVENG